VARAANRKSSYSAQQAAQAENFYQAHDAVRPVLVKDIYSKNR